MTFFLTLTVYTIYLCCMCVRMLWIVYIIIIIVYSLYTMLVYFVPDKHEKRPTSSKLTVNRCKTLIHFKCIGNKVQENIFSFIFSVLYIFIVWVQYNWACVKTSSVCHRNEKKNSRFCVCILFRINNMQVVVIGVIVAHKQPSDYALSLFIRWFYFLCFFWCIFEMVSENGMKWHIIKLDRIEYLRLSHEIYEHFGLL